MIRLALFLVMLAAPVGAVDLALPEGAERTAVRQTNTDRYLAPVGPFAAGQVPFIAVEGIIQRSAWRLPAAEMTPFQILKPMRTRLEAAGYEVVLDCDSKVCGGFDFRFAVEVLPTPNMYVNIRAYHYLTALVAGQDGAPQEVVTLLASTSAEAAYVQIIQAGQVSTTPTPRAAPKRAEVRGNLAQLLLSQGHAVLSDLVFESGSADLDVGGFASLEALAKFLKARPDIKVALVGHTDSVGSLSGNIALSKRRAQSVRRRIIQKFDLPAAQIEAEGMGYLSPVASNLKSEGREENRRVEVVILSAKE